MEKKILNVVLGGVINNKEEILLLKRKKEPYIGFWGLPGGKINFGEHIEEAIEREIKEETNIDTKLLGLKGLVHEIIHEEKTKQKRMHFLIWVCQLKPLHFKAKASAEGQIKWFSIKNIPKLKKEIIPSDFLMMRKFFNKKSQSIPFNKVSMVETKVGYRIEKTDL